MTTTPKTSGLAIAAIILASAFCIPFAPMLGIILGIVALSKINNSRGQLGGKGMAIAAIAVGGFMIFVNIGMLAAIAIPNFIRYQLRAKSVEAKYSLQAIGTGASAYFVEHKRFPEGDTGWVPDSCPSGLRCERVPDIWAAEPWSSLGFAPGEPHYYQLRYSADGATFTAEAQADLDGDGEFSHFKITGAGGPDGVPRIEPPENLNRNAF